MHKIIPKSTIATTVTTGFIIIMVHHTVSQIVRTAASRLGFAIARCQSTMNSGGRELDGRREGSLLTIPSRDTISRSDDWEWHAAAYRPAHS